MIAGPHDDNAIPDDSSEILDNASSIPDSDNTRAAKFLFPGHGVTGKSTRV
jgi:hypothetical protein